MDPSHVIKVLTTYARPLTGGGGGGGGGGVGGCLPMLPVDFKKCQCCMSLSFIYSHVPCRN